jgi:hypothetical protein
MSARSNHDVFEAFAEGRSASNGNVYTERFANGFTVLYSYSTPVAINDGSAVSVDSRKYSVTTSKQITGTIMPCHRRGLAWDRIDHEAFRTLARNIGADLRRAR